MINTSFNFADDTLCVSGLDMQKRYHDPLPNTFQDWPVGSG